MKTVDIVPNDPKLSFEVAKATDAFVKSIHADDKFRDFYLAMVMPNGPEWTAQVKSHANRCLVGLNKVSKAFRANTRAKEFPSFDGVGLAKSGVISKADLDVGTLTNFAQITGGQSLGYVSLDTQMARGTVRPNSFTLYQALHKSAAFQVVDYWAYASNTGGGLPGTAFQSFSNVGSGTLSTSAGVYSLQNVSLKLAVNGRAITTALAAQNSFVDVTAQENINAALTVLSTINWTSYWGDPAFYTNQFVGLASSIPTANVFDFQTFSNNWATGNSWNNAQTLFNMIYQTAGKLSSFQTFGRITHAFMSPLCAGSLQSLTTTLLNNIVAGVRNGGGPDPIIVNGELTGIRTRFGEIQFPIDLFITARDKAAQAILNDDGTNNATSSSPAPVASVTATIVTGTAASGNGWTASYTASSGIYAYAVAAANADMTESTLKYIASGVGVGSGLCVSGVGATTAYQLTITPTDSNNAAFRIYRSGLTYGSGITASGNFNVQAFRYVGTVAANGSNAVTWVDKNLKIPGSETIFLLDMDENDMALDYRFMLPLTRIELFAQNLFMPWAVATIGAIRNKVPKFHGLIQNYVSDAPDFNPLAANANAA